MRGIIRRIETKALVQLITSNTRRIITTIVEERMLDHRLGVVYCSEIARAQTSINFKQSLSLRCRNILIKRRLNIANRAIIYFLKSIKDLLVAA